MYKAAHAYSVKSASIIRITSVLVPLFVIVYGLMIKTGFIHSEHYFNDASFMAISFWWVYMAVLQYMNNTSSKRDAMFRLIAYHMLASGTLLFITGVSSPFSAAWILLMLASYVYFSRAGLQLSMLWFGGVIFFDIFFWYNQTALFLMYDVGALLAISLSGLVTLSIADEQIDAELSRKQTRLIESLQRDRFTTIINNMNQAVISTDRHGVIELYNAATLNLLDTNLSLKGKVVDTIFKLKDADDKHIKLTKEMEKSIGSITRDDLRMMSSDHQEMRLEIIYSPIRTSYTKTQKSDAHDGYIILVKDITKAKSLEEERDEFISVVSHELRTPITIVEGALSNLQLMMQHPDVSQKMRLDAVDSAHDQIVYLSRMVNDLSTLSRAERGVADGAELIDVKELIKKLYDEYSPEAAIKKLHLDLDVGASLGNVYASRLYLEELLQNFITNAIKYTKEGSVKIIVKKQANHITFAVKDTGIGISKSDQEKIFDKFYRSEDYRTRETSGTGLGLYVAKKLAHKIGTHIDVTSRLNHGSTFSISLPVSKK